MSSFAFVFPGQGSQSVGMLDGWAGHRAVRDTLAEASDALGTDVGRLIREGPKEVLDLTVNTQVVMLVAGVACWRAWRAEGGGEPAALAGHSLGEYSALVAAGALSLADAAPLVRLRGQAMQDAVPAGEGAMLAVLGLDGAQVAALCAQAAAATGEVVAAANYNDPKQTVISGTRAAIARAADLLKAAGAKRLVPLAVSAPFHCALMRPAAEALRDRLAGVRISTPRIPVINNIDVVAETDAQRIRDALYRQAFGPVRWVEVTRALAALGVGHVVECGPGRVLSKMVARIDETLVGVALSDPPSLAELKAVLGGVHA
ncbi:MAG: ACP S-malonyltransferase [Rubrivivax sp.]|jgi:[acyl-carrier-protein] S-malonyltransferase|nr:ACP S-malonyltransferase [Rubrivivax sp.]